jgi:hypothetical protein
VHHVEVQPEAKPEVKVEAVEEISKLAEKLVTEAIPAVDTALESLKEVASVGGFSPLVERLHLSAY